VKSMGWRGPKRPAGFSFLRKFVGLIDPRSSFVLQESHEDIEGAGDFAFVLHGRGT
jgi:hypothetical protein